MNAATKPGATKPGMKDQARDLTATTDAAADAASGGCGVQIRYLMNHCRVIISLPRPIAGVVRAQRQRGWDQVIDLGGNC